MPGDRAHWAQELPLSAFLDAYYQHRDISGLSAQAVLVIGPGQGLANRVLAWRGYRVTTLDVDETFRPDHVGSVHDMSMFSAGQFDVAIASHVLEHLPTEYLDGSLAELARVARYSLVYLPVAGRHVQLRFLPAVKAFDLSLILDVFDPLEKPDGTTPRYAGRQHFWEVGLRGYRPRDIRRRLSAHFEILSAYRNRDWTPSYNFVLRSRSQLPQPHGETPRGAADE